MPRHGCLVMGRGSRFALLLLLLPVGTQNPSVAQGELRVAAAADLKFAMTVLQEQFEKETGDKVIVTYGSSGNFFSQIQNGAPFDLFFSADVDYPEKLRAAGLADDGVYEYATGRMVLWAPANSKIDVASEGWKALLDRSVEKIAIANPQHAPYGRAAVAALQKAGIYDQVKHKLVYGENVAQAAQFVQSGNAQAGILALSLALAPGMRGGKRWVIPSDLSPIRQGAIVLRNGKNTKDAKRFLDFVKGPAGRQTLRRFGFRPPGPDRGE